jgi:hypothetical protein
LNIGQLNKNKVHDPISLSQHKYGGLAASICRQQINNRHNFLIRSVTCSFRTLFIPYSMTNPSSAQICTCLLSFVLRYLDTNPFGTKLYTWNRLFEAQHGIYMNFTTD